MVAFPSSTRPWLVCSNSWLLVLDTFFDKRSFQYSCHGNESWDPAIDAQAEGSLSTLRLPGMFAAIDALPFKLNLSSATLPVQLGARLVTIWLNQQSVRSIILTFQVFQCFG